jgi:thioredoxin 2
VWSILFAIAAVAWPTEMPDASETTIVSCPKCGTRNRIRKAAAGYPHCQKCGAPLPWIVEVDDAHFKEVVLEASVPVLVDFWAPWCGPCRIVSPMVERLAVSMAGKMKVAKLNTDTSPVSAGQYEVRGIPTLMLVQGGKELDRVTGAMPEPAFRSWLEPRLQRASAASGSGARSGTQK